MSALKEPKCEKDKKCKCCMFKLIFVLIPVLISLILLIIVICGGLKIEPYVALIYYGISCIFSACIYGITLLYKYKTEQLKQKTKEHKARLKHAQKYEEKNR